MMRLFAVKYDFTEFAHHGINQMKEWLQKNFWDNLLPNIKTNSVLIRFLLSFYLSLLSNLIELLLPEMRQKFFHQFCLLASLLGHFSYLLINLTGFGFLQFNLLSNFDELGFLLLHLLEQLLTQELLFYKR